MTQNVSVLKIIHSYAHSFSKKDWKVLNDILDFKSSSISDNIKINGTNCFELLVIADSFFFVGRQRYIHENIPDYTQSYMDLVPFNPYTIVFLF